MEYIEDMQEKARTYGFVETAWGRKRRLPNMQLDKYEFDFSNFVVDNFDPLAFDTLTTIGAREKEEQKAINYYTKLLDKAYGRQKKGEIKAKSKED